MQRNFTKEYDFLTTFYWSGYPDLMTQAQYDEFVEQCKVRAKEFITERERVLNG